MSNKQTRHLFPSNRSVFRWFLIGFLSFSVIFFIALIPLISYNSKVFTELEIEKSTRQMESGISQLENTVTSTINATKSLNEDMRFLPFRYLESDLSSISISVKEQMSEYLYGLTFPLALVSDSAIQFSDNAAVMPNLALFNTKKGYYPNQFCVDDLTFDEWKSELVQIGTGFLPVHHVTTLSRSYDALIYTTRWTKDYYLYVCMNISDVKAALIDKDNLDSFHLTIENSHGDILYTDVGGPPSDYHSVTQRTVSGGLVITVHIPFSALSERMTPLYSFLGIYLLLCVVILAVIVFIGSHLSSKPLVKMVQSYESDLHKYRIAIETQSKILQARYMEKALHGSLTTESDFNAFHSYFPDFPQNYYMVLLGLEEYPKENGTIYPNVMSTIQYFLQQELPNAYQQQLTNSTLLLVISKNDYLDYSNMINYLIENIDREEPCYHAWGFVSNLYSHPKNISIAYWQIQDLRSRIAIENLSALCTVSDFHPTKKFSFQMSDAANLYSAITNGNSNLALLRLNSYAAHLKAGNRSIFEMFHSILLCIKQEYAELLFDIDIPAYHPQQDMYSSLSDAICTFSSKFLTTKEETTSDAFARQVKAYIDLNFTDPELCGTTLEEHFQCSFVKIRKAFSKDIGVPISTYIEMKRMELSNELLLRGEDSVSEVARKCGFASYNTFHKAYRRTFGHAPSSMKQD